MRLRFSVGSLLFSFSVAVCTTVGQIPDDPRPVRIQEIRRALRVTTQTPEQIEKTNRELIEAVRTRGVNFALSKEQEWALGLEEASEELLKAIREAVPEQERQRLIKAREQEGLYYAFANNYSQSDINSRLVAIAAGREFVRRFRDDPNVAEIVAYLQRAVPALERSIRLIQRPVRTRPRSN